MTVLKPTSRPNDARFSCGPTKKRPGWELSALAAAPLGRTHRGGTPKARLAEAIERTGAILEIPDDYKVIITPASDTGAMEGAMWSMLGARGVDVLACDEFGGRWLIDARDELKPEGLTIHHAPYGQAPDYSKVDFNNDVVFTWNATAAGVRVTDGDWIKDDREGLTICDATSAAFAMDLPWDKLDVTTFSWQKCMGGEAQHGIAIFSPRARQRLREFRPSWPVPRLLQLFEAGEETAAIYEGSTINTPSLLCTEDYLDALKWAAKEGWRLGADRSDPGQFRCFGVLGGKDRLDRVSGSGSRHPLANLGDAEILRQGAGGQVRGGTLGGVAPHGRAAGPRRSGV
jgi:phosphoserine aminotransferase